MVAGAGFSVCGLALLAYQSARHSGEKGLLTWNLLQWLGLGLPAPGDRRLVRPTLALLNCPIWLMLCVPGFMIVATCWLVRAID
jgi:hypothetical protein